MGVYFVDEYERQIDERGRIILPAKICEKISRTVYITQSPTDKCLQIYTEEEWGNIADKLSGLPVTTDSNARAFVRQFFGTAASCEVDKQRRILLNKKHIDYAGLTKDIVLVGANTKIEVWSKTRWDEYNESVAQNIIIEGLAKYNLSI